VTVERAKFEELVAAAIEGLPEEFLERLDNVDIIVDDYPTRSQLRKSRTGRNYTLLGLYEGVPLTERHDYTMVLPDKITIFQRPIEEKCRTEKEIKDEVRRVVVHEIAHHFGIGDGRLRELGR
jgi:predicted Zn-dependent protease with MMP-like domain